MKKVPVVSEVPKRTPLFISLGQGTTGTHGSHGSMCSLHLQACHWLECCPGLLPQQRDLVALMIAANHCTGGFNNPILFPADHVFDCDAAKWRAKLEPTVGAIAVTFINILDGLSDTPVTGIIRHLLPLLPVERPVKFILTTRESQQWSARRAGVGHNQLICRFDTSIRTNRMSNPFADYIECADIALEEHARNSSRTDSSHKSGQQAAKPLQLKDVFLNQPGATDELLQNAMEHYQTQYAFEVMRHHFAQRGEQLILGKNLLHVDYFNQSVNYEKVATKDKLEILVREYLQQKE